MSATVLRRLAVALAAAVALVSAGLGAAAPALAHSSGDHVPIYAPIRGESIWNRFGLSDPSDHHVVFSHYGYPNDWAVDIYRAPGSTVVSPFGSRTAAGHPVTVTVVGVRAGCATGNLADGGSLVTLEATDATTGDVLGIADVMHVDEVAVSAGQTVGIWTELGVTSRFRYSSCYQVNGATGTHVHLEVINAHRYSCYLARAAGTTLTDETRIGQVGSHGSARRQAC